MVCLERAERARLREERQWLIMSGADVSEEILQSLEKNGDDEEDDDKKLDELDEWISEITDKGIEEFENNVVGHIV